MNGFPGSTGFKGAKGEQGDQGEPGVPGGKGEPYDGPDAESIKGNKGQKGEAPQVLALCCNIISVIERIFLSNFFEDHIFSYILFLDTLSNYIEHQLKSESM